MQCVRQTRSKCMILWMTVSSDGEQRNSEGSEVLVAAIIFRRCFTSSVRAIGSSFQLAITAPQLDLTGYGTATAQSCPLPHHLRPPSTSHLATTLFTTPHHTASATTSITLHNPLFHQCTAFDTNAFFLLTLHTSPTNLSPTTSTNLISSASLLLSISTSTSTSTSTFNPTPPHPTPPHPHVCPMPAPHTPHFTQRNSFNQLHHSQPSHSITSSIHTYIPTTTSHPPIPPPTYPPAGLPACLPSYLPTFLPSYASSRQLSAPYFGHTSFSALLIKMSQYMHLSHSRGGKRHEERRRREEEEKRRRGEEEKRKGMRRMQPSILSLSSFCRNIHICTRPRVHSTSDMCDAMTGASQLLPPSDAAAAADDGDHGGRRNYHDDSDNGGAMSADAMRQADTIKMHDTVDDTLLAQPRHTSVQSTGTRRREAVQADHSGDSTPTHIAAVAIGRPFPLTVGRSEEGQSRQPNETTVLVAVAEVQHQHQQQHQQQQNRRCFTSSVRAIGSSFQLAITAPQLDLTGYGTATAQSCPLPHHLRPPSTSHLATTLFTTPHHTASATTSITLHNPLFHQCTAFDTNAFFLLTLHTSPTNLSPTTSTNLISSASLLLSISTSTSTSTSTFNPTPPHPTPPHPHVCPMPAPHTPHFTQRNSFNQLHHSQPSHSITSSIHTYIPTTTSHPPIPPPTYPPAGLPACLPSYLPTFLPSYASSRQLSAPYFGHTSFSALLIKMSQYMHLSHSRGGKRHEERRRREEEEKRRRGEEEKRKGMRRMQPSILSLSSFCRNIHICTRPRVHSTSDMCDAMTGASQLLPPSDAAAAADDGDHGGRRNYHDDSDNGGGVVDVQH
ncbi:hypothetical protein TcWFU_001323 [Taenia crassiceps]|uniref:Uncharacterized protein n=1 Tax=Taenia crassiceps TaxID=6207 RepID=A0ABR4QCN3_9CEST